MRRNEQQMTALFAALAAGSTQQIVAAYKDALVANLNTLATPIVGWTAEQISAKMTENAAASSAQDSVLVFITDTLGQSLPVRFTL